MKTYICKIAVEPTTLTAGTVYQAFVNSDSQSMRVKKIFLLLNSSHTGNSKSVYAFARIKGMPTGGTSLVPTKFDTQSEDSMMVCMRNQAGLTMTEVVQSPYFLEMSVLSKTQMSPATFDFDNNEGLILAPNEGLVIFADHDVVSGSGVTGCIEWREE